MYMYIYWTKCLMFIVMHSLSLPLCFSLSLSLSLSLGVSDTCCISDFSLAVTGDSCIETELKTRPHADPRYMAPEFLADPSAQNNMESLKKGDMYSYGLVLWEIARRCTVLGEYSSSLLMYTVVCQCTLS